MKSPIQAVRNNVVLILTGIFILSAFTYGVFFSGFDKYYFAPALVMIAAIAGMALWPGFRKGWAFPSAPAAVFLFLFWFWMAISTLWSQVPNVSMIFLVTLGAFPLLFFSYVQSERSDQFIAVSRIVLLFAAALLALWACVQFIFLGDIVGDRVHYPMLNANNLAVTMAIGLFMALPLYARQTGVRQIICGLIIVMAYFAVLTTQSRGSTLGIIIGSTIVAGTGLSLLKRRWKSFTVLLSIILIETYAYGVEIVDRFGTSHLTGGGDAGASNQNRIYLWTAGLKMLRDHPFPGTGLGTFYLTYPPYRLLGDTSDGFFLHLDPLQFGIEMGFPAIILFYAFAIAVLVRTIRALRVKNAPEWARTEMMCAFGGLTGLLLNSHIDFDLYMLPSLMLAAVLLCLWYRGTENILGPKRYTMDLQSRPQAALLVPAIILVLAAEPIWIIRAGLAIQYDGYAAAALQRGDIELAAKDSARALRYGPDNYDRGYFIDAIWRSYILQKNFVSLDAETRQRLFDESMELLDRTLQYNPYNVQAMNQKALLAFLSYPRLDPYGVEHARAMLEQARKVDPVNFELRLGLARMLESQGRIYEEIQILEDGLRYDLTQMYAPPQYYRVLAEAKRKNGDAEAASKLEQPLAQRQMNMQLGTQKKYAIDAWVGQHTHGLLGIQ
jgi:putative inorganic carbon (HCO3(-)) transporter